MLQDASMETADICALALSFAQKHYGLSVSQDFTIVGCSPNSSPDEIYRRLGFRQRLKACEQPVKGIDFSHLKMHVSSFLLLFFVWSPHVPTDCSPWQSSTVSQSPADLLRQISSFNAEKQGEDVAVPLIPRRAERKKPALIQVISSTDVQPQEPQYRLQLKAGAVGAPRRLELAVELPMVSSVSDCQLRISKVSASTLLWTILMNQLRIQSVKSCQSWTAFEKKTKCVSRLCVSLEDDILLEVEALYYLRLDFPADVDEDTASAVFNKKRRTLTLTVDASDCRSAPHMS